MTEMCGRRLLWRESRSMAGDSEGMVFGINEREQQYVHMKSQPKICKWQCGRKSEINGQRTLPSSKRF